MKQALVVLAYLVLGLLSLISGITLLKRKNCTPGEKLSWGILWKKADMLSGALILIGVILLGTLLLVLVINLFNSKYGTLL